MTVEKYTEIRFRQSSLSLIDTINGILGEYEEQGLTLTLRQLYYQLVARDIIPNTLKEYGRISRLLTDARMAGLVDWDMIEDRTREFDRKTRWESPEAILEAAAESFHKDMWKGQEVRPFCVVEKDALSGVLSPVCNLYDVPLLAAKGYCSVSTLREFTVEDIIPAVESGQEVIILHLGDHDPSGLDMTRDIEARVRVFLNGTGKSVSVLRLALNMDQVEALKPPTNPAKTTDRRFAAYRKQFGTESWELDALRPDYMADLVEKEIRKLIDFDRWQARSDQINLIKAKLREVAEDLNDRPGGAG
jgi:hypothetical protein